MYGPTGKDLLGISIMLLAAGFVLGKLVEFAVVWIANHVQVIW